MARQRLSASPRPGVSETDTNEVSREVGKGKEEGLVLPRIPGMTLKKRKFQTACIVLLRNLCSHLGSGVFIVPYKAGNSTETQPLRDSKMFQVNPERRRGGHGRGGGWGGRGEIRGASGQPMAMMRPHLSRYIPSHSSIQLLRAEYLCVPGTCTLSHLSLRTTPGSGFHQPVF